MFKAKDVKHTNEARLLFRGTETHVDANHQLVKELAIQILGKRILTLIEPGKAENQVPWLAKVAQSSADAGKKQ